MWEEEIESNELGSFINLLVKEQKGYWAGLKIMVDMTNTIFPIFLEKKKTKV